LLHDSIDFRKFVKICTLQHKNQEKCEYVNGVIIYKNVADKRMASQIANPRILVINNSLGYVREEEGYTDLESIIKQEEPYVEILISKINLIKPDLIFVQNDVSRTALDKLRNCKMTVIANVKESAIRRIARYTQTIPCPSTNLIDKNFVTGTCGKFRVEKTVMRNKKNDQILTQESSLLYLEECSPYLGCTVLLSGPHIEELKMVK